jgi:hypothetical protein
VTKKPSRTGWVGKLHNSRQRINDRAKGAINDRAKGAINDRAKGAINDRAKGAINVAPWRYPL